MPKHVETAAETQHRAELARLRAHLEQVERRAADQERLLRTRAEVIERLEAALVARTGKRL